MWGHFLLLNDHGPFNCIFTFVLGLQLPMKEWSREKVFEWMNENDLIIKGLADIIRKHDITGDLLVHCTEDQLTHYFPRKGFCFDLIEQRDKQLEAEILARPVSTPALTVTDNDSNPYIETFRKFDCPLSATDKYKENAQFQDISSRPTDLLTPVHRFVATASIELNEPSCTVFSKEVILFATACLNERTNGVIHFGVNDGKIVGFTLSSKSKQLLDKKLTQDIKSLFPYDQFDSVLSCVRPIKFVEVVPRKESERYIIEVEVIPSSLWCGNRVFTCKPFSDSFLAYRFGEDGPIPLQSESLINYYSEIKSKRIKERGIAEKQLQKKMHSSPQPKLKEQLIDALCNGKDLSLGDKYPVLVLSPVDRDTDVCQFDFLKTIPWKTVLDFGSNGAICERLQEQGEVYTVLESQEFDPEENEKVGNAENLAKRIKEMRTSGLPSWVFVNGYKRAGTTALSLIEWKQQRREGLREFVREYLKSLNKNRIVVIYLVLSDDFEIMMEGVDQLCSQLSNPLSYVALTENVNLGKSWQEQLLAKNICLTKEVITKRTISGLPWEYVKETFDEITDQMDELQGELKILTRLGTKVLPGRKKKEWNTLDIVALNQCQTERLTNNLEKFRAFKLEKMQRFYQGEKASWWNYQLDDAVERRVHKKLVEKVSECLRSKAFEVPADIQIVTLYHQRGAGGTTCAKNILWDFKHKYKCAEVLEVTDHTSEQIGAFREFGEQPGTDPEPVLLLLDNIDQDKKELLLAQMREKSKQRDRNVEKENAFCVCLMVQRSTTLPSDDESSFQESRVYLGQHLNEAELQLFHAKDQTIEAEGALSIPTLLVFNILKKNFDPVSIKEMVSEYITKMTSSKERFLVQCLAFINYYDVNNKAPILSSFDSLMARNPDSVLYDSEWDKELSDEFRVLVHVHPLQASNEGLRTLSVSHTLLSREILNILNKTTLSMFAMDFFRHPYIGSSYASKKLIEHLGGLLIHREMHEDGSRAQFAPLVQEIQEKEDLDATINTLLVGHNMVKDININTRLAVGILQQIARVSIEAKDWQRATHFAALATTQAGDDDLCFQIIDTQGQVCRRKVDFVRKQMECARKYTESESSMSASICDSDVLDAVKVAHDGIAIFKQEQKMAYKVKIPTVSGYVGILQITASLLDILALHTAFDPGNTKHTPFLLHTFLVDKQFVPPELKTWEDQEGINYVHFVKNLKDDVAASMRSIEEPDSHLVSYRQTPGEKTASHQDSITDRTSDQQNPPERDPSFRGVVRRLKDKIDVYMAEMSGAIPSTLNNDEKRRFRRNRMFMVEGYSLESLQDIGKDRAGQEFLLSMRDHAHANWTEAPDNIEDGLDLIQTSLALWTVAPTEEDTRKVTFEDLSTWSKSLYSIRSMKPLLLDVYMYYVLFNWPKGGDIQHQKTISEAISKWLDAYFLKYPNQQKGSKIQFKKGTRHAFYFANGEGMQSIIHSSQIGLHHPRAHYGDAFWKQENIQRTLKRFPGTLIKHGEYVLITDPKISDGFLSIPSNYPIHNSLHWNKQVSFIIGFTWMGPKAFDIELKV